MAVATLVELLDAGVHFGHQTQKWNPKMKQYIFGAKNGIYIIDLRKTSDLLDKAYEVDRLIYFYTGNHPQNWQISVLQENGNWHKVSALVPGKTDALEVKRLHVPIQKKISAVKILFTKSEEQFIMPELELWNR